MINVHQLSTVRCSGGLQKRGVILEGFALSLDMMSRYRVCSGPPTLRDTLRGTSGGCGSGGGSCGEAVAAGAPSSRPRPSSERVASCCRMRSSGVTTGAITIRNPTPADCEGNTFDHSVRCMHVIRVQIEGLDHGCGILQEICVHAAGHAAIYVLSVGL